MAQLISVKLSRFDNSPWGFRLQGGKDFGTPLVVQKVNGGSPAEAAGLRAGDAVIKVNNTDTFNLRHKDAQDVIVRAGNNFEITIQRGGSTWKPSVTPVSSTLPTPKPASPAGNIAPVTKTSLAAKKQDGPLIGSGHNFSPKPFLNGNGEAPIKSIVNKQYNSPVGIYSEETIAETLSAQAEVLAGGVLGVNFKKNEKNYNAENSEVFKMVQEADKEPRSPEPAEPTTQSGAVTPTNAGPASLAGLRHVSAPETKPQPTAPQSSLPPGQNICADCERLIVGVFVRIKDKNLHVECFKCSTCGTSLKNVGYYNINNKLYCDIHAKLVARQNPPAPGLVPVTTLPGKAPAGTISAALANVGASIPPLAPLSPSLNNHSSPLPFSCNRLGAATSVQEGLQRLRLENGTSGFGSSAPPRAPEPQGKQIAVRNGAEENAKTFTSTLIIQTGNEVGSTNVDEKHLLINTVNKEIYPEPIYDNSKVCEFELTTTAPEETTITDLVAIAAQPFPVRKQASSTNSIAGPKPFQGGIQTAPSLISAPSLNSGSNTLPRPQSQNASGRFSTLPKPKSSLFRDSYFEESDYYEVTEILSENPPSPPPPPSTKSKSLVWPPAKPLEEITYPTASPLYINPNPILNERQQRLVEERRKSLAIAQQKEIERQRQRELSEERRTMEAVSCSGPVYRKVQLCGVHRESRSREVSSSRAGSRADSRESLRRSLTPTRITQPIPQPWTATVTTGVSLYEQPLLCHNTVCDEENICEQKVTSDNQICERKQVSHYHHHQVCQQPCQPVCKPVYRPVCPSQPPQQVSLFKTEICEPEPEPEPEPPSPVVETEVTFTFRRPNSANLSEMVPPDVAVCPKGIEGQHEYVTETTEKDVGPLHIKKTTIYEKTVEVVDPDDETETRDESSAKENGVKTETRQSENLDMEVENISERRDVAESADIVASAVDTQQLVEKIKQEEKQSVEEEQISSGQVQCQSFSEKQDIDGGFIERHKTVKEDETNRYEELTEEIRIQENFRQQEIEEQRRQSLREQVQVHQSLRQQQIPERRPPPQTLQERRLSAKFGSQDFSSSQQQASEVTCVKKHVQFASEPSSGIQPLPPTTIKNSTPKQWQSEMVKALTTAPGRPYSPLDVKTEETVEERYAEEECYIDETREVTTITDEPKRSASPFREALTTAPDRPYTPLGFYDQPNQNYSGIESCDRSQTPTIQATPGIDGYCAPAEILYSDRNAQEAAKRERRLSAKSITPQPLPTPPPDYHLRDSSPPRSRSQTPSNRSFMTGLKKPGAIPYYQRNLVASQKIPIEGQPYVPSRSPTPNPGRSKSPAQGPPEPPACYIKAQAPKIREDDPPKAKTPTGGRGDKKPQEEGESYTYHEEKNTPRGRLIKDVEGSLRIAYAGDEESFVASEKEIVETLKCPRKKPTPEVKSTCIPIEIVCPVKQTQIESCQKSVCVMGKLNQSQTTATCPIGKSQSDRFPRTGVCVLPPCPKNPVGVQQSQTSRKSAFSSSAQSQSQSCQRTVNAVSQSQRSAFCGTKPKDGGVTVLPCKTQSESGSKAGVVVMPSEGGRSCSQPGVRIVPTQDRKGVCVSPYGGQEPKSCGQPSGSCGRRSGSSALDIGPSPLSGVCVTPCSDGSVCVAPCPKPQPKSQCPFARSPSADLPFPQIPLPYDDDNEPVCPLAKSPVPELSGLGFQPIHTPRTNLGCQLTQLIHKTNKQSVQVFKPQAQCSSQTLCQTQTRCSSLLAPISKTQNLVDPPNLSSHPDLGTGVGGSGAGPKSGAVAGNTAPKRGRGVLTQQGGPGSRVPLCGHCNSYVRGPFITALGNIWCPDHFICVNGQCRRPLQDIGFVEEKGQLYCEYCFEQFIAPPCNKCNNKIKGECLNAIGKHFHPECFNCSYCGKLFGNNPFFLEDGLPYCEADWNELFTTKCFSCGFPVEAGDRWVEALSNNYHSQCFNCTMCKKNLEGQSFYAKGGRPFCKNHAR